MKKITAAFCVVIILTTMLFIPCYATGSISEMDIEALLCDDGTCKITETLTTVTDDGTEFFFPFITKGVLDITDLTVSDRNGEYETLDEWNTEADFDEKARKCGLNKTGDGYEICFGISEYGKNTYTVKYSVLGAVGSYTDSDGFNYRFYNDKMETGPTKVDLTIRTESGTALTDENANIWMFGNTGQIQFENEIIHAWSTEDFTEENHMTVMVELKKDILHPLRKVDDTFESAVKTPAMDGSDYDDEGNGLLFAVIFGLGLLLLIIVLTIRLKHRHEIKKFISDSGYYRDVPNNANLNETYVLTNGFLSGKEESIIGARILKLINIGSIEPRTTEDVGFLGRSVRETSLALVNEPAEKGDEYDATLYSIIKDAAGSDSILQQKELEKYCKRHPQRLRHLLERCQEDGNNLLSEQNCVNSLNFNKLGSLNDTGRKELAEAGGFRNYLRDFSLISEHGLNSAEMWQDFMIYALLFGIAEEVAKQLKKVYPQDIPQIEYYERNTYFAYGYSHFMYSSMVAREREIQAARSGGSGGIGSFGGGGGFSGGGSGGGTR